MDIEEEDLLVSNSHTMISWSFYIRRYKAVIQDEQVKDLTYDKMTEQINKPHLRFITLIDPTCIYTVLCILNGTK